MLSSVVKFASASSVPKDFAFTFFLCICSFYKQILSHGNHLIHTHTHFPIPRVKCVIMMFQKRLKLISFYSTFKSTHTDIVHVVKVLIKPIQYIHLGFSQAECKHCSFDLYISFHLLLDCCFQIVYNRPMTRLISLLSMYSTYAITPS